MPQKFGRNYRLTIYPIDNGPSIVISMPFTIVFNCTREINASVNTLNIDIYNLSEAHRKRIFQDINVIGQYANKQLNPDGTSTEAHNILLEIGYGKLLYKAFYGKMLQSGSAREGTNIITRIQATSTLSDIAGTQVQITLQAGQTVGQVINYLIQQFPNLKLGAIGSFPIPLTSPVTLSGSVWDLLKKYTDGKVYEDNGIVYVLNYNEALSTITEINDATGLLETPRRMFQTLEVTTLMEASVQNLGQQLKVTSQIKPEYNGTYKVLGITHAGTISGAISGEMRSIFKLQALGLFNGLTVVKPVKTS